MDIGVVLPHAGRVASSEAIAEVVRAAEHLGLASVWAGDHIAFPTEQDSAYPYAEADSYPVPADRDYFEGFLSVAHAAACSSSLTMGVSVSVLPYRHVLLLAKLVGTLHRLLDNRFVLGAGSGWLREEFEALGKSFQQRGVETDRTLEALLAWSESGGILSEQYTSDGGSMVVHPHIPREQLRIWVGGRGARARRRAVEFGAAWHPPAFGNSPDDLREAVHEMRERGWPGDLTIWAPLYLVEGPRKPDQGHPPPWVTGTIAGDLRTVEGYLSQYADAGVSHAVLAIGGSIERRLRVMEQIASL